MQTVRSAIASEVHKLVGSRADMPGFVRGDGDAGLLGPGSAAWKVHGDFATMMIGGVSALLLQMLHPVALAGVWDHSNFRHDMAGRLRRTAQFMAGTTFGSTDYAERLIDHVRSIHDSVTGVLPNGTPYAANDPAVLTWVHASGAWSFLGAYLRYRDPWLSAAEQDRYYAETAEIARRLGATNVPVTRHATERYLQQMRAALRADARSREVARVVLASPAPNAAIAPVGRVMMQAGIDLMPRWAQAMHGLRVPLFKRPLVRASATGTAGVLRWALKRPSTAA